MHVSAWPHIKVEVDHAAAAEVRYLHGAVEGVAGLLFGTVSVNVRWKSWAVGYANAHISLH